MYEDIQERLIRFNERDEKRLAEDPLSISDAVLPYFIQGIATRNAIIEALKNGRVAKTEADLERMRNAAV